MDARAYLTAFHREGAVKVRPIELAIEWREQTVDELFELAFVAGQNETQPVAGCYSVSVGDVIEIEIDGVSMRRRVLPFGFSKPLPHGEDPRALVGLDAQDAARGIR